MVGELRYEWTTRFPESSKSPPLIPVIFAVVTPLITPMSVTTPELSIFTKLPAVRPLDDDVAIPYMKPSFLLNPIASIPASVFDPIS